MSTTLSEPPARRLTRKHRSPPAGLYFSRLTRIARRFGAGFEQIDHEERAEGNLSHGHGCWFRAVMSFDRGSGTLRLFVRVAYLRRPDPGIAAVLQHLMADDPQCSVDIDRDDGRMVILQALVELPSNVTWVEASVAAMFRRVAGILHHDGRLIAALEAAGARLCRRQIYPDCWPTSVKASVH